MNVRAFVPIRADRRSVLGDSAAGVPIPGGFFLSRRAWPALGGRQESPVRQLLSRPL